MKVLEIGASSILDKEETKDWVKLYHNTEPKYGKSFKSNFVYSTNLDKLPRDKYDLVYISMGSRRKVDYLYRDYTLNEFISRPGLSQIWDACVNTPIKMFNLLVEPTDTTIVYLDSISALTKVPYPTEVEYSISKVALSTYLKNLAYNNDNIKVIDIHIGSTKSRMCSHGMDSDYVFERIMKMTNLHISGEFKYKPLIIDKEDQINNLIIED